MKHFYTTTTALRYSLEMWNSPIVLQTMLNSFNLLKWVSKKKILQMCAFWKCYPVISLKKLLYGPSCSSDPRTVPAKMSHLGLLSFFRSPGFRPNVSEPEPDWVVSFHFSEIPVSDNPGGSSNLFFHIPVRNTSDQNFFHSVKSFFCSTSLPLSQSTRWVRSTLLSLCCPLL